MKYAILIFIVFLVACGQENDRDPNEIVQNFQKRGVLECTQEGSTILCTGVRDEILININTNTDIGTFEVIED